MADIPLGSLAIFAVTFYWLAFADDLCHVEKVIWIDFFLYIKHNTLNECRRQDLKSKVMMITGVALLLVPASHIYLVKWILAGATTLLVFGEIFQKSSPLFEWLN